MKAITSSCLAFALAGVFGLAQAQISDGIVKIGVLSDMSSLYTDIAGAGSVVAAKMAIEDSGIEKRGVKVELVSADHLNKPDVGSSIAGSGTTATRSTSSSTCLVDRAGNQPDHQGEGQGLPRLRRGIVGSHRQGVLAEHRPLDLRHVDARQRHGRRDRQNRRRHLVLPYRRLRVRAGARARH